MMGIFSSNKATDNPHLTDLDEVFARIDQLERQYRQLSQRLELLENENKQRQQISTEETASSEEGQLQETVLTAFDTADTDVAQQHQEKTAPAPTLLFLPTPNIDGTFSGASEQEIIGKSVYQLTTFDNQNGVFIPLDTPDAIATAMISVSAFIKPACKVVGPTAKSPRHIITEEEGTASCEGNTWKVIRKAIVRFE